MVDYCTINDGTVLRGYELLRTVINALTAAVDAVHNSLVIVSQYAYLVMPSGWVFPIINEGVWTTPSLPSKKFWAVKLSAEINVAHLGVIPLSYNVALPKQSIAQIWDAFIAPYDYYLEDSEYWPYIDEETGEIKQGLQFTPVRKFGVFAHMPEVVGDIALVGFVIYICNVLGLFKLAKAFIDQISMRYKNRKLNNFMQEAVLQDEVQTNYLASSLGIINEIKDGIGQIDSKIGIRLVLK